MTASPSRAARRTVRSIFLPSARHFELDGREALVEGFAAFIHLTTAVVPCETRKGT